jgi:hypothetical protein
VKYILGLDLGQAQDPTALVVLERIVVPPDPANGKRLAGSGPPLGVRTYWNPPPRPPDRTRYECGHIDRLKLGTPYPDVAEHVAAMLRSPVLAEADTALVVDATGIGRPVVDLLIRLGLDPVAITITGGDTVSADAGGFRVPKRDLVGTCSVLLQTKRIQFSEKLPLTPLLVHELLEFRVKIDPLTAHDSYGARVREGAHDDLVLAVAVAAWYGEHWQPPLPRRHIGSRTYSSLSW